ncbi:hypothetical protein AAVH_33033 [Aphelenchoides avenae]|nr:hypothetical protein AAVH_33033 [Aphelenchus avenae]
MHALFVTLLIIGPAAAIYRPPALQRHAIVLGDVECSDNVTLPELQVLIGVGNRLARFSVTLQAGSGAKFRDLASVSSEGGFQDGFKLSTDYVLGRSEKLRIVVDNSCVRSKGKPNVVDQPEPKFAGRVGNRRLEIYDVGNLVL